MGLWPSSLSLWIGNFWNQKSLQKRQNIWPSKNVTSQSIANVLLFFSFTFKSKIIPAKFFNIYIGQKWSPVEQQWPLTELWNRYLEQKTQRSLLIGICNCLKALSPVSEHVNKIHPMASFLPLSLLMVSVWWRICCLKLLPDEVGSTEWESTVKIPVEFFSQLHFQEVFWCSPLSKKLTEIPQEKNMFKSCGPCPPLNRVYPHVSYGRHF